MKVGPGSGRSSANLNGGVSLEDVLRSVRPVRSVRDDLLGPSVETNELVLAAFLLLQTAVRSERLTDASVSPFLRNCESAVVPSLSAPHLTLSVAKSRAEVIIAPVSVEPCIIRVRESCT